MIPIIGDLIQSTVGNVVNKLTEHYLPASMSEKEKAEFIQKANELVIEEMKNASAQMDSVNQTMREEAKSEHFIQYAWRPIVGLTFSSVIINNYILLPYLVDYGLKPIDLPSALWNSILVILGVAAGTRGIEKIQKAKNDSGN